MPYARHNILSHVYTRTKKVERKQISARNKNFQKNKKNLKKLKKTLDFIQIGWYYI